MVRSRGGLLAGAVVVALTVAACTGEPAHVTPSTMSPSAATTMAPTCPAPTPQAAPPTDFPHPTLTRHPPTGPPDAADQALARQGLAALRAFGGPISASAFQHYLDASGAYLALPVDGLLTSNPALVTELDTALVDAARTMIATAAASPACTPVPFSSGWLPHADVDDPDWAYALGRFSIEVFGTVTHTAVGGQVRVTYRAAVGDTYDFDPGSTFAQFARLALDGHAADFLDGGLTALRTATVTSAAALATPGFG